MLRGLYTAVSAMETSQKKLDVISNNIANVNTNAFKKDVVVTEAFPEVLIQKINGQFPTMTYSRNPLVDVKREKEAFYLTTKGGYFIAEGLGGKSYSSSTSFAVDEEGYLRTFTRDTEGKIDASSGNYILDSSGNRIQVEDNNIDINQQGQIIANGQVVANLVFRPGMNTIGTINSGLRLEKIQTYFTQGGLEETGNLLDLAIEGNGFFRISTPMGEMYTRNGNFTLNDNGEIVTKEGYYLMGQYGSILLQGDFQRSQIQIGEDGAVIINNEFVDKIDIVHITNVKDLRKHKDGYYRMVEGIQGNFQPFEGRILQGFLETSNINPIQEMVDMISVLRLYESNQKVVQAYDEILQKAVNEIGRV